MATGTLVEASVHARTTTTALVPLGAATPIGLIRIQVEHLDVSFHACVGQSILMNVSISMEHLRSRPHV
jgi:hypothetical protein